VTQPEKRKTQGPKKKQQYNAALKYSGMGMQMLVAIGLGVFIGGKLDAHFQTEQPLFTALLAVVFLGAIMYTVLKDLMKN